MISVEEALARVLGLASTLPSETLPLRKASGRVLATPVSACLTQPPFAASAMDGYAILEADHIDGATLSVIGEAGAGHAFAGALAPGQAVRIFTGAPVPLGAERVVLQEDVTLDGGRITLSGRLESGTNIRPAGQDFREGDELSAPRRLRPADLALIASMNQPLVNVARRPIVAFIATGDELVMPGEIPRPDQIVASNSFALAALAESAGAEARLLPIARDSDASLRYVFGLAEGADVIVTIGGASVGDHDLVGKIATELGLERAFWKIAMRPGKPLMAGKLGGSILLGLPGNPVSAIVCAHLFLLPLLAQMQGLAGRHETKMARLGAPVDANGPRTHYMRARLSPSEGVPKITPFDRQDSALLSILSEADALLIRPIQDGPLPSGALVSYLSL
ncbi:MAG: gephyrin-like molybdotransferase Glp [Paracoccaceae bacterium]